MKKENIDFKIYGKFASVSSQKVFISFHPDDINQMEKVAEDIHSIVDCDIYYHTSKVCLNDMDISDYEMKLKEMTLFVIVVTTNYLFNDSLSKNWEFGFAIKNNIPILPIAMESNIENFFSAEMNRIGDGYGDAQLLKFQVTDKTEISYQQKLFRDVRRFLIGNNEIEKVKGAFSGQIFLSYRKKDRKYANELMKTIHDIPSLRNVSIWYDEFISSGDRWDNQIKDALTSSDIFLLMVSPSITEPDNYVIREEYPEARRQNKEIVSVKKTDNSSKTYTLEELEKSFFPGLKILVDGKNTIELEKALQNLSDCEESNPGKDYLIGLAFLNGVGMERNIEKGVSLIVASAQKSLPEAVKKLADMYWYGDGVATNYENSILWRKELVLIYDTRYSNSKNESDMLEYIDATEDLISSLYTMSAFRESLEYSKQMVDFVEQVSAFCDNQKYASYCITAYDFCYKNSIGLGLYDDAIAYAKRHCDYCVARYDAAPSINNLHNLSVAYGRTGGVYYAIGDFKQAEIWYLMSLELDLKIDKELQSIDSAYSLSATYLTLGEVYVRIAAYELSQQYYEQAVDLRKRILDAEHTAVCQIEYAEALIDLGTALLFNIDKNDNKSKAKALFIEAKDIAKNYAQEYGTIESQHMCSLALNRCAAIYGNDGNFEQALEYYFDSLERRKKILSKIRTAKSTFEYALTLYFVAEVYKNIGDKMKGIEYYECAVEELLPILSKDRRGDWHRIFAFSSFGRFRLDTFSGERYLKYAEDSWKWLTEKYPEDKDYHDQYMLCKKMHQRCYPDTKIK